MRLPGPFDIRRVIEFEGGFLPPDFLFAEATQEVFSACAVARDPRFYDADQGTLVMSFHALVVRTPRSVILVDTCVGNHKERPDMPSWHMQNGPFLHRLAEAGVHPEEVDFVLCTHMHADHVGWNTQLQDGRWVPTFPNAKYVFARSEVSYWEAFHRESPDNPMRRAWDDSVRPILEAGQAALVDSDYEIEPGIYLVPAPGHTPGNVMLCVEDGAQRAYLTGDVMHHPVQIEHPDWSSGFCADPDLSRHTRRALLEQVADTGAVVLPAHFPTPTAVRISSCGGGFDFTTLED